MVAFDKIGQHDFLSEGYAHYIGELIERSLETATFGGDGKCAKCNVSGINLYHYRIG